MNASQGKFYVKNTVGGTYQDLTTKFNGLAIMKVDGLNELGAPINVYTAQWVNSQREDFLITTLDANNLPVVIRKNVDIEITFVISRKYMTTTYTAAQSPTGNPKTKGYYELADNIYRPTWDTTVVSGKTYYTANPTTPIDELTVHDSFIQYMTNTDVWIKSTYMGNKERHCICLDNYKPTLVQIKRGDNSFITGTLKLHHIGD